MNPPSSSAAPPPRWATSPPELYVLVLVTIATVLMWVPYMGMRILTRGPGRTFADPADPTAPADPAWAERARHAHANAVENFAVFAPLVIILALIGASGDGLSRANLSWGSASSLRCLHSRHSGHPHARLCRVGATLVIAATVLCHTWLADRSRTLLQRATPTKPAGGRPNAS
ncbi:MAPEG family protein [Rhizobium calliandrae]|uniref:MAPEG family protein n=1 Tax=Rhizobium calliandrae TaxID=1312182 RepID=UPI0032E3AB43